jgi:anti-sigma factor RsiW
MTDRDRASEDELHALVDGRLAPERRAAVEQHVAGDPELAERVAAYRAQRNALREQLRFKAEEAIPARLRIASIQAAQRRVTARRFAAMAAAASWLVIGVGIGWYGKDIFTVASRQSVVEADAIAAHRTFVVDATHPVEVDASREAHLVQWLSKRLGRPMKVPNLNALGFKLMGGRLLPTPDGVACQIMYDDEKGMRMTLYMRPGSSTEAPFRVTREGNVRSYSWLDRGGFGFAVTAETDAERLRRIAESVAEQVGTGVSH